MSNIIRRERAVACPFCAVRRYTYNVSGLCDAHEPVVLNLDARTLRAPRCSAPRSHRVST